MGLHFGSPLVHTYPKSEQVANFMHGNSATDEIQKSTPRRQMRALKGRQYFLTHTCIHSNSLSEKCFYPIKKKTWTFSGLLQKKGYLSEGKLGESSRNET